MKLFADAISTLDRLDTRELSGTLTQVRGLTLRVADLALPVGAYVQMSTDRGAVFGEVVGFEDDQTVVMLLGDTTGVRRGDHVVGVHSAPVAYVGPDLLGRVVDGMGRPIDNAGPIREAVARPLRPRPIDPMRRIPIDQPLGTGVRCIDSLLPVGRGQRLGVFAGPGVGKSTLLGMMARQTQADVSVVALIGERGREVQDFIQHSLTAQDAQRTVIVVATADDPALMRIRAALYASSVAEFFRDQGMDVVLLLDSITRFCQALRQVGLAAGEPPATKGYTPSVFAALPTLLERSGRTQTGSITGLYTILVEGDDLSEPVSDACRGILDGHIVLNRELANRGQWPAIDVLQSVSRVAGDVIDRQHHAARIEVTRLIGLYRDVEDLLNIGAYASGSNPNFDLAISLKPQIDALIKQKPQERVTFEQARKQLLHLALIIGQNVQKLGRRGGATAPVATQAQ